MKLLLIAPEGLEVQGFKGSKHAHHLNLAVVAALATPYFKDIKIIEEEFEPLDLENLRPHYARTLWAWSDALEARLAVARGLTSERVVRAYRLYLAGSAMGFEQGWMSLFQMLAAKPSGRMEDGPMRGAQSQFPFNRGYLYG